jgi:class 3 adenylate cyclase
MTTMLVDLETLGLTEIIRLREQISEVLVRRFERNLALAFTDVVGSTAYFAEFGDEAGRGMMQRHLDLLGRAVEANGGRIVDTAGDGAFTCFKSADDAVGALGQLQKSILEQNLSRTAQHQLAVRAGIHWGPVLTDGVVVTGDAVNLCARVTSTGTGGEIRLSKAAFLELSGPGRMRCTALPPTEVKGIRGPVEMMQFRWHAQGPRPTRVWFAETGERIELPDKALVSFGRLRDNNGVQANDIVLVPAHPDHAPRISRWQFELRQTPDGPCVSALSDRTTEVDGVVLARGQTAPLRVGTTVKVAGVMTLVFEGDDQKPAVKEADRFTMMIDVTGQTIKP